MLGKQHEYHCTSQTVLISDRGSGAMPGVSDTATVQITQQPTNVYLLASDEGSKNRIC